MERKIKENLEEAFQCTKDRLAQYPNCYPLILGAAAQLDSWCMMNEVENPERKRNQARIYSKTGRREEAYKAYEELLFSEYQMVNGLFLSLYRMAVQDQDTEKARALVEKQSQLARIFEMGKYNEVCFKLDLAAAEKDAEMTIETMTEMLSSVDSIYGFTRSSLYEHMTFQERKKEVPFNLKDELIKCFRDEESFGYMKEDERWLKLVEG